MSWLVQVRTIRNAKDYGIAVVVALGWQLDGSKYWFLWVFFLWRSTSILPFSMLMDVSKKGMESWFKYWILKTQFSKKNIYIYLNQLWLNLAFFMQGLYEFSLQLPRLFHNNISFSHSFTIIQIHQLVFFLLFFCCKG